MSMYVHTCLIVSVEGTKAEVRVSPGPFLLSTKSVSTVHLVDLDVQTWKWEKGLWIKGDGGQRLENYGLCIN